MTDTDWDAINERAQQIIARAEDVAAEAAAKAEIAREAERRMIQAQVRIQRIAKRFCTWATTSEVGKRNELTYSVCGVMV